MSGSDGGYKSFSAPSSRNEPQEPSGNQDIAIQDPGFDGDRCPICFEGLGVSERVILPCDHPYHAQCIANWLYVYEVEEHPRSRNRNRNRARCPMCRKELVYTCGGILSDYLIRPGVTILPEELDLRCPSYHVDSDGPGDHVGRPHRSRRQQVCRILKAWEYVIEYLEHWEARSDSEDPGHPEHAEHPLDPHDPEGPEDPDDFEHPQPDEDTERMLETTDHPEPTDLTPDASQPQGEPQENHVPEEQNAGEGPELEHSSGPANTNEDIREGKEEDKYRFFETPLNPERPKCYDFSLVQYCQDNGDMGVPIGEFGTNRIDIAHMLDDHPIKVLILTSQLKRDCRTFERLWPDIPLGITNDIFEDLRNAWRGLKKGYERFRREHEGHILLNEAALQYRGASQERLGGLLDYI